MGTKAERVYEARRQGLLARVAGETGAERAEELITAWEEEAERRAIRRTSDDFWKMAGTWVFEEHRRGRRND